MSRPQLLSRADGERRDPVVVMVGFLLAFEASMYAAVTPVLPHYARALHAGKPAIGLLAAAYSAGVLPGSLIGGWLAGRAGMRRTTLIGLLLFAAAVAAFGLATDLLALDLLRIAQGLGCGLIWGGALTWAIAVAPRERRGAVVGAVIGAAIFGTLLGPLLGLLAVTVGTGPVFLAVGAGALGLAGWVRLHDEPAPSEPETEATATPIRAAMRSRGLRLGVMMVLLDSGTIGVTSALIPLRLAHLGAPVVAIGGTFVLASALSTVLAPWVGRVTDRRGPALPISVGLLASGLLLAVVALPQLWVATAVLCMIVLGGPLTAFTIPAVAMMADAAEHAGLTLVLATTVINVAYALGEMLGAPAAAGLAAVSSDAIPLIGLSVLMALALRAIRITPLGLGPDAAPAEADTDRLGHSERRAAKELLLTP